MKKFFLAALFLALFASTGMATAFAYPNERLFWQNWQDYDKHHFDERSTGTWDGNRVIVKYKDSDDSSWYEHYKFSNLQVFFADNVQKEIFRASFQCKDGIKLLDSLTSEHGIYTYQESGFTGHRPQPGEYNSGNNGLDGSFNQSFGHRRHHQMQSEGEQYYWIGKETILKVSVNEDKVATVEVWDRLQAEKYALEQGRISSIEMDFYDKYFDNFPTKIARRYIEDVLTINFNDSLSQKH